MTVPPPTLFLDVAGRFTRKPDFPIVAAGISVPTAKTAELREAVLAVTGGRIVKWTDAHKDIPTAKRLFRSIGKRQLPCRATFILKHEPEWSQYWAMGDRLEEAVKAFPQKMPYATASVTLKYNIYSYGIADTIGGYLGRHRAVLPPKTGVEKMPVCAVCDSDIPGEQSQKMFQQIFEKMEGFPQTREGTGIELKIDVCVKTEQEEPLLMLPDHIAGYIYSLNAYGKGSENAWAELITEIELVVSQWPKGFIWCKQPRI